MRIIEWRIWEMMVKYKKKIIESLESKKNIIKTDSYFSYKQWNE